MNYVSSQKLSGTALGLSIFALVSTMIVPVILPLILGPIAIILAILSKGSRYTLPRRSQIAVIISIIAIALNLFILVFACVSLVQVLQDPAQRKSLNDTVESTYGMSLDELLDSLPSFMRGNQ